MQRRDLGLIVAALIVAAGCTRLGIWQLDRLRQRKARNAALAERLARAYGTQALALVEGVAGEGDWGERFGADLTEREVRYLMRHEWAMTAEDVLWRRSKLGLRLSGPEADRLDAWMRAATAAAPRAAAMAGGGAQ